MLAEFINVLLDAVDVAADTACLDALQYEMVFVVAEYLHACCLLIVPAYMLRGTATDLGHLIHGDDLKLLAQVLQSPVQALNGHFYALASQRFRLLLHTR